MSFNIRNIREISNDPLTKFTNTLAKKLARFLNEQQQQKLENKEDIYSAGEDVESVIRFHDFTSTKTFDFVNPYYPPNEPDNFELQLWIRGHNMGNTTHDWSETGRKITIIGEPMLVDGAPHDDGIHTGGIKSTALRFNRSTSPTVNKERIVVNESNNNRILGSTIGMSYFIRFRVSSIADQGGISRTLFEKIDNNTPNDAVKLTIKNNGRLQADVKIGGTDNSYQTPSSTISINTVYDVWLTYDVGTATVHIYVNNVDQTLTPVSPGGWHSPLTDHDFYIMHRGGTSSGGYVDGDLYDFRVYYQKVVSATEVGRMWTNKWTIADIPFGQVMITNYYSTYAEDLISYTTTSYTSTSYTTT